MKLVIPGLVAAMAISIAAPHAARADGADVAAGLLGGLAIGGLSCGLFTLGGASIGILGAMGGAALGLGTSVGGLAVGSIAVGGAAIGFVHAIGGAAFGPSVISGMRCDDTALDFFRQWIAAIPRNCR